MSLGHFGATASKLPRPSSGGAGATELMSQSQDNQLPSQEGMPAGSSQVMLAMRGISHNLVFSSSDADTVAWATGIITLSDGSSYSITGSNTGNMVALTYIYLDIDTSTTLLQTSTTYSNAVGNNKYLIAVAQNATTAASFIVVSGNGGIGGEIIINANMISNLLITAAQIANATITSGKTVIALRNISHNLVFSSTDLDTVAWASGTITLSDGTAYSISSGNTGNMAARTYIYLDPSTSTTVLQTTTTAATASGDGKYLIATAVNVAAGRTATFTVFSGAGGVGGLLITSATQIGAAVITASEIANLTITASQIAALTITASEIAALTINSGKLNLKDDAAYGDNFLINGSFESWSAGASSEPDGWVLTGAAATVARITSANNVQYGLASVSVTAPLNIATDLAQSITISTTQNTVLRGNIVAFSCRVKTSTASRVFLKVDDGIGTTSSSNHTGGGTFETLTVIRTIDSSATKVECSLEISSGASISATFDGAILARSQTAVEFAPNSDDQFLKSRIVTSTGTATTSSATMGDLDSMSLANVAVDGKQSVLVALFVTRSNDNAGSTVRYDLVRDSTVIVPNTDEMLCEIASANVFAASQFIFYDSKPAAGLYTYKARWRTTNAAFTATTTLRWLQVVVIPEP